MHEIYLTNFRYLLTTDSAKHFDESTIFIEGYDFSKTTFKSVQAITIFSIDSFLTSSISLFQILILCGFSLSIFIF